MGRATRRIVARELGAIWRPAVASPKLQAVGIVALLVLAVTLPSMFSGHSAQASADAISFPVLPRSPHADAGVVSTGPASATDLCRPTVGSAGYVNPLAGARVKSERIDQGVDYAGSGTLSAMGAGVITTVSTDSSGWPGAFIEYQLRGGVDAGCYVFYAEGITPIRGLHPGQPVQAGQVLATLIPQWSTGIELGWGAGSGMKTYAGVLGQWNAAYDNGNDPTAAGRTFSALIAALGGPPGRIEGRGGASGT